MTRAERANPDILKHSRKKAHASGSGTMPPNINKLLKMHRPDGGHDEDDGRQGKGGMMKQMWAASRKMGLGGLGAECPIFENGSEAARGPAEAGPSRGLGKPGGGLPGWRWFAPVWRRFSRPAPGLPKKK